jgi:hypothetical protein
MARLRRICTWVTALSILATLASAASPSRRAAREPRHVTAALDATSTLTFVGTVPCRLIDTRTTRFHTGAYGPPRMTPAPRTFVATGTTPGVPVQ